MGDFKVLVFGSFTEDETRSLLQRKPPGNSKQPVKERKLQFGSLDFQTGIKFGGFNSESSRQLVSEDGNIRFEATNSPKKDEDLKVVEKADHVPAELGSLKENGIINDSTHASPLSNGVKDLEPKNISVSSLCSSKNEDSLINQSQNFHVLDNGHVEDKDQDGTNDELSVPMKREEILKAPKGPITAVTELLPHGLINLGNLCFLNATLQALLSCTPFVKLLQELKLRDLKAGYPTLSAFSEFISNFEMPSNSGLKKDTAVVQTGTAFRPSMFEGVLKKFTPDVASSISGWPRQEDAQEFLSFLMDQMHNELLKLEGQSASANGAQCSLVSSTEDDEWETVGPKNKSAVTRTQSFIPSELSDIFGGQLRSVVTARGNKASATVQPFLLLHLDIYPVAVCTIEHALHLFSVPENLEGYRTSATGQAGGVTARKSVKIQKLSKIMILHLMRFTYGSQGSTKLRKPVRFPLELVLGRELLVSPSTECRKYELVATITHHGSDPSKGHYTADARYSNGQWLRFDDASVATIGINKVLHDQAYVLFYKQV